LAHLLGAVLRVVLRLCGLTGRVDRLSLHGSAIGRLLLAGSLLLLLVELIAWVGHGEALRLGGGVEAGGRCRTAHRRGKRNDERVDEE